MSTDEAQPLGAWDLCRLLDARVIPVEPAGSGDTCPVCGCGTGPSIHGGRALCLACTEVEVGEKLWELTRRVSHRMTRKQWEKLEAVEDVPRVSYRTWKRRVFGA